MKKSSIVPIVVSVAVIFVLTTIVAGQSLAQAQEATRVHQTTANLYRLDDATAVSDLDASIFLAGKKTKPGTRRRFYPKTPIAPTQLDSDRLTAGKKEKPGTSVQKRYCLPQAPLERPDTMEGVLLAGRIKRPFKTVRRTFSP